LEETAIDAGVGVRLPSVSYPSVAGDEPALKVVDYWAMTVREQFDFRPNHEIDALVWLPVEAAIDRLSYAHDVTVLSAFAALPRLSPPLVLLRHASAGERSEWTGPDADRPLDEAGWARSRELAPVLACFGPRRLVSGP